MNFCPNCYTELTGSPGPRFKGHCPKCKRDVVMKPDMNGPLTAKMNVFMGLSLSKEIKQLQETVNELLQLVKSLPQGKHVTPEDARFLRKMNEAGTVGEDGK